KISKLPFSSVKTVVVAGVVVILTLANGSFVASKRTLPVKVPFALPSITSSLQLIKISERKVIIKKYIDFIFYKIYCCYLPRYICIPMPYCKKLSFLLPDIISSQSSLKPMWYLPKPLMPTFLDTKYSKPTPTCDLNCIFLRGVSISLIDPTLAEKYGVILFNCNSRYFKLSSRDINCDVNYLSSAQSLFPYED